MPSSKSELELSEARRRAIETGIRQTTNLSAGVVDPSDQRAYHAKLRGDLKPRGFARMADDLTAREIQALDPAPRGPGIDPIIEELAGTSTGRRLRWRNSGEHPLTLAFERGKINAEQFAAGEEMRNIVERLARSGRDSTDFLGVSGGGMSTPWTDLQSSSVRKIQEFERRLSRADYVICRKFCGEGYEMVEAVRAARIRFDKNRVVARVCEALDALAGKPKKHTGGRRKQGMTKYRA